MNEPLTIICAHVVDTLPDSISRRKELLTAVKCVVSEGHPAHKTIVGMLAAIQTIEIAQPLLSEEFHQLLIPKPTTGNGGSES
jgi:hypothetical protein